ncbi:copper resistance protein NlpE [Moraxella sp. ZY210820]|uniref:copper resistance protein NlpE n=1 Tax=unclassified Moraxella TaxID=2685852 RepID=UPI00272FD60D|nr:copper resistance protein NlpE [Moraxella sp. ZY210820]WLF85004.1 copper resistance protein NlpE N-terminal domain-containing protein [Moraxella sp. ZY210820]
MKKSLLSIALFSSVLAVACTQQEPKKTEPTKETTSTTAPATQPSTPATPAETTPAYVGTYNGTLPCADCSGIDTTVELKADGTYVLTEKYTHKDQEKVDVKQGKATFDATTSTITLESNDPLTTAKFVIEGDVISKLDADGKKATTKEMNYDLKKVAQPATDAPKAEIKAEGEAQPQATDVKTEAPAEPAKAEEKK